MVHVHFFISQSYCLLIQSKNSFQLGSYCLLSALIESWDIMMKDQSLCFEMSVLLQLQAEKVSRESRKETRFELYGARS